MCVCRVRDRVQHGGNTFVTTLYFAGEANQTPRAFSTRRLGLGAIHLRFGRGGGALHGSYLCSTV